MRARFLAFCVAALAAALLPRMAHALPQCPNTMMPQIVSGTSYTVQQTDNCWLVILTNPGTVTVTLPAPGLIFSPGFKVSFLPVEATANISFVQLTDDSGNLHKINDATTLTLGVTQGAILQIQQDLNWWALPTGATSGGTPLGAGCGLTQAGTTLAAAGGRSIGDTDATLLGTDNANVLTDTLTAQRTWTLPLASSVPFGCTIKISDAVGGISNASPLIISTQGSPTADTINGDTAYPLSDQWDQAYVTSLGPGNWVVTSVINIPSASTTPGILNYLAEFGPENLTPSTVLDAGAGLVVGGATGGAQGAGTVNMVGCFINGVACSTGPGGITELTGDATAGPGSGSQVLTLANTNAARVDLGLNVGGALAVAADGTPTHAVCADLSDAGAGCAGSSGITALTGDVTASGTGSVAATLATSQPGAHTWAAAQTFGEVVGAVSTQSGTSYTLAATDCGTEINFTAASTVTVTIPNSLPIGCNIAMRQGAAGAVTPTAGSGTTLNSPHTFTKTFAQNSIIGISVVTNSGGSSAVADFVGDGQ